MDLRHLALILQEGWQAAEAEGDVALSRALAAMAETAVGLHQQPDGGIWDVERDFAALAERLT